VPELFVEVFLGQVLAVALAAGSFWIQQRGRDQQRRRTLAEVRDAVAFLDSWLSAHEQVAPNANDDQVRVEALRYLDRAYSMFAEHSALVPSVESTGREVQRSLLGWMKKSFLLIGRLERPAAKVVRALYYVMLVWTPIWSAAGIAVAIDDPSGWNWFGVVFLVVFTAAVPAWLLYRWAVWLDRRAKRRSRQPVPTPTPSQESDHWSQLAPPPPPPPPPPRPAGRGSGVS
jgi:hypothetical protein